MEIKKGSMIKTSLSDNTIVLDITDNKAILFSGTQFVIATNIKFYKEEDIYQWDFGTYAPDIKSIVNLSNDNFDKMKETIKSLSENNYRDFVKSIMAIETNIEKEESLDNAYDEFMKTDCVTGILNQECLNFLEKEKGYDFEMEL